MIVLDTTVLVYAVGGDHPLAAPCREVVQAIGDGSVAATTTVEVLQEFTHVRARRRDRSDAVDITRSFARLLHPLLPLGADDLERGLELFAADDRLGTFDAVLAAATIRAGATLVSADQGFAGVPSLRHLDPSAPGFPDAVRSA